MNQIEKVARAIWSEQRNHWGHYRDMLPDLCEWDELTQSKQRELMREAKAAIAAMPPVPTEPVAWMYEREADVVMIQERLRGRVLRSFTGWTETPLYALTTPPAGGSDAE